MLHSSYKNKLTLSQTISVQGKKGLVACRTARFKSDQSDCGLVKLGLRVTTMLGWFARSFQRIQLFSSDFCVFNFQCVLGLNADGRC